MQEISFHEAFSLLSTRLTDAEIARKLGISRQTVSGWHHMAREPHKRHRDGLIAYYRREICIKRIRDGCEDLLIKYESQCKNKFGFNMVYYDQSKENAEAFHIICLAFLCCDSYFLWNNRRGQLWDDCGWSNEDDKKWFESMIEQGRINELVGLALL